VRSRRNTREVPVCHTHVISFGFEPFKVKGEVVSTMLELGSINLPVKSWKEFGGKTFEFPVNPEDGYIDGSSSLFGCQIPADGDAGVDSDGKIMTGLKMGWHPSEPVIKQICLVPPRIVIPSMAKMGS
jgi:hypothetical protein